MQCRLGRRQVMLCRRSGNSWCKVCSGLYSTDGRLTEEVFDDKASDVRGADSKFLWGSVMSVQQYTPGKQQQSAGMKTSPR